jgi:hypothetical protein
MSHPEQPELRCVCRPSASYCFDRGGWALTPNPGHGSCGLSQPHARQADGPHHARDPVVVDLLAVLAELSGDPRVP